MIQVIIAILFIIFVVFGLAYLVVYKSYTLRDLLVLGLLLYPILFLGRFSTALKYNFIGHWYLGFELSMVGFLALFIVVKVLSPDSGKMRLFWPIFLSGVLLLIGLFSGLVNASAIRDYGAVIQAGFRWFVPFLVACAAISTLPKTPQSSARLANSYILVYGILTPLLILVSALFTTYVAQLMGWDPFGLSESAGSGFTRGWTPTGSTISSGMLVVFAYAMVLTRLIRKENVGFNAFVAVLCVLAVFFTLARSVMFALIVFHLFMFKGILWRNFSRIAVSLALIIIFLVPSLIVLNHWYSFERFLMKERESINLRWSSLKAGLTVSLEKPALGLGPGLLYWEVRQPWGMPGTTRERVITIRDLPSAKEPHNLYVLAFAETGLVGLAMLGVILLYWLRRLKAARMYSEIYVPELELDARSYWSMLISFAIFCLTSASILIYPKVSLTMWSALLIGLHCASTIESETLAVEQSSDWSESDYLLANQTADVESYDEQLVR